MHVLITGGAGFIGSHVADALLQAGHRVRALDNLDPEVHGPKRRRPAYLDPDVELLVGDVRDEAAVDHALRGIDAVFHFAAAVGVGQSMYEMARYTEVNNLGTAVLLEAMVERPVQRMVVASSMSLYGEGAYRREDGRLIHPPLRTLDQLRHSQWELIADDGTWLEPIATGEDKPPMPTSVYALSKHDQERLSLMVGAAYGIPTIALRFFNVYGPRQTLSNPYTGVIAIFASRVLNGNRPLVFEDGNQRRDFVHVADVAQACRLALETPDVSGIALNIGSGETIAVAQLAQRVANVLGRDDLSPEITRKYRVGDIRHCFADVRMARDILGYIPGMSLEQGLGQLADWLHAQTAEDRVFTAHAELEQRGLTV